MDDNEKKVAYIDLVFKNGDRMTVRVTKSDEPENPDQIETIPLGISSEWTTVGFSWEDVRYSIRLRERPEDIHFPSLGS